MNLPQLPNNRLILNGHKLHTQQDLLDYVSKRLQVSPNIQSLEQLVNVLKAYKELQIAVRHGDTFLQNETLASKVLVFAHLEK
jgi:hypothetical protein